MIQGMILAGNAKEYNGYLHALGLKSRNWPHLTQFKQLKGFHTSPPIVCTGTYASNPKYAEIRRRAVMAGIEVADHGVQQSLT